MAASISPLSTPPISIGITPSVVSEIERSQGKSEELKMPDPVASLGPGEPNVVSDVPTIIDLGDGDIELKLTEYDPLSKKVNNTTFKSHKHLLNDFARLKEMIKGMERYNSGAQCITVYRDERGVEDFKNMFKVLYASLIKGPFEFDAPTLVSCLRLATAYEYPELRKFSVDRLEGAALSPIERIELAREFDLSAWDEGAFQELVGRDEPITRDEAKALGGIEEEKARREAEEKKKAEEEEQRKREEEEKRQREEEEKRQEEKRDRKRNERNKKRRRRRREEKEEAQKRGEEKERGPEGGGGEEKKETQK
ncbi:hypothetical protein RhiXN_00953 [Rhizoctonia solani]|uniref:BTB domain-containing protein n=1 Tax=Rhizoctonia solani TaxID=456999 RepID=A0A8H8NWT9_9AGAM|nr:uncharacterized protein RhiXN_00953 [Rhizoctonia solani]QRW19547.1 hypothetical protein RhiXN_00953 [Rhizoctonia solani]